MILPTKHLSQDRALLTVGALLLKDLSQPKTVSALWEEISRPTGNNDIKKPVLRYDAYILTLDLLFLIGAIEFQGGLLNRRTP
ncbi:MAG: ABC-three component system middle component 6 [Candidatus Competibacter sp.]